MDRVLSDRYELQHHVARGGMADIYRGVDRRLGRDVAVKILRPELSADESYIARFRDEARAAAQLNHPNVVSVFDWGTDAGEVYIVMEWVDGPTLREVLRSDGPLDAHRASDIAIGVLAALVLPALLLWPAFAAFLQTRATRDLLRRYGLLPPEIDPNLEPADDERWGVGWHE